MALIAIGIYAQVALDKTLAVSSASASSSPIAILVLGVLIFFISFFGCCGAWKESYCMVTTVSTLTPTPTPPLLCNPPTLTPTLFPVPPSPVRRPAQHHLPGGDRRRHRRIRLQGQGGGRVGMAAHTHPAAVDPPLHLWVLRTPPAPL